MLDSPEIWTEEHVNFILDFVKIFEISGDILAHAKKTYMWKDADKWLQQQMLPICSNTLSGKLPL